MSLIDLTPPATLRDRAWRALYRVGYPAARLWWRVRRRSHVGALVAVYVGEEVLLLRSSYRAEWALPGGGVEAGETPLQAARRELLEEVGITADALEPVHVATGLWEGRPDEVHFFKLDLAGPPALRLDNREVTGARLVSPAELRALSLSGPTQAYFSAAPNPPLG